MNKARNWLKQALDYEFSDVQLFELALTHRSSTGASNERLEFLGDAVLDFVVSDIVFRAKTDADEGDLSRLRASLVKDASLADIARRIGIGEHLILGEGERKTGGHRRRSILADALEALFGAVFLDAGFDAAARVIRTAFGERLDNLPDPGELRDPKTKLQEWLQARQLDLPEYELVDVSGKAHEQRFRVSCTAAGAGAVTEGEGSSRRQAEQQAAAKMFDALTVENS